jgi:hypothetical protein
VRAEADGLTWLDRGECLRLLASVPVGRLIFTMNALPTVRVVNFAVVDDLVLVRTAADTTMASKGEGVVAEAGDEVEPAAECFDVAGGGFDGCEFAAFDLGDPAGGDAHGLGELGLSEAVALALFGEPVAALAGHQFLAAPFGFLLPADAFDVGVAVPLGEAAHRSFSSSARSFR